MNMMIMIETKFITVYDNDTDDDEDDSDDDDLCESRVLFWSPWMEIEFMVCENGGKNGGKKKTGSKCQQKKSFKDWREKDSGGHQARQQLPMGRREGMNECVGRGLSGRMTMIISYAYIHI